MILFEHGPTGAAALFEAPSRLIVADRPEQVDAALAEMAAAQTAGFWLAGYGSYELGYALEPKLRGLMPEGRRCPLLVFGVYEAPVSGAEMLSEAEDLAEGAGLSAPEAGWSEAEYARAFDRVAEYIAAGDCYQVNLTMPMQARFSGAALGLYGALRRVQPVRHGVFADLGVGFPEQNVGPVVLSRSPELFFRLGADGAIETRPMKGTTPRGADAVLDAMLRAELLESAKNRAENLMIVDLLRNDISRLCEIGSVKVPELYRIESYATVHQMVSRVTGQLRAGVGIEQVFRALFPCGSITGAPKIRAMEIIRELEPAPRGVYCGGMGWIAPDGSAEFNVAIRTLSLFGGGEVVMNVGGGVVYDSTAASEYEEALWKARFAVLG